MLTRRRDARDWQEGALAFRREHHKRQARHATGFLSGLFDRARSASGRDCRRHYTPLLTTTTMAAAHMLEVSPPVELAFLA